jgi:hypothetical protein
MDLARSVQDVCEMSMLQMARHVRHVTGEERLCLAGGVGLNCVANGIIQREAVFPGGIWIQPAPGDATTRCCGRRPGAITPPDCPELRPPFEMCRQASARPVPTVP